MDLLFTYLNQLSASDLDAILDKRDKPGFDNAWCHLHKLVPSSAKPLDVKDVFITLSKLTQCHEICSYIADDLDLIQRANAAGVESEFLSYLKNSYAQGFVPCEWFESP